MKRRLGVIVAGVVAAALIGLTAAYLTGLVAVGDPFLGTWRPADGGKGALVVTYTPEIGQYEWYYFIGNAEAHFIDRRATRDRNTLTSVSSWGTDTLVFQPWKRHLVLDLTMFEGRQKVEFAKVSDSTSPPPESYPSPSP